MKKDGIRDFLKSSRLKISLEDAGASASHEDRSNPAIAASTAQLPMNIVGCSLRGVPKSGRVWKQIRSERFSTIRHDKPDKTSWHEKLEKKSELSTVKLLAKQLKDEKLEREKAERERLADAKKRKAENEKKNEIVVPIKNVAKMKRLRKKQLRTIKKT